MLSFITGNKNKFAEVQQILPDIQQLDIDLAELQELDPKKIVEYKLQSALQHHAGPFIVEDTSLYLDCLNGLPGPLGKWFERKLGNDGLYELVCKYNNPNAHTTTMIGYVQHKNKIIYFEGTLHGKIVKAKGTVHFGFNPIFKPDGYTKTLGELTIEEKNKISMRGIAVRKLKDYLEKE